MAELIGELRRFVVEVGLQESVGVILIFAVLLGIRTYYRDYRKKQDERALIQAKEAEIRRLAEDNRAYRDDFFRKYGGMSLSEIEGLGKTDPATPLEPMPEPRRRKAEGGG